MKITSSKNNFAFSDNEYAYIRLSGNQTTDIANTNPIKFNTVFSGNVTFDPITYRATLKKNRTYRLKSNILAYFSGNTGNLAFSFYNVTSASLVGINGYGGSVTLGTNIQSSTPAFYEFTPTVDTVMEIRILSPAALTGIYASYSYWEIQQINIVSPVIQDISTTLQAGIVMAYTGSTIPVGWLNCDGSAVSRTVYNKLYAAISTTWGAGDGSTTFNIPDLRSATLRGVGTPTLYTSNTVVALADTIDDKFQGHKHAVSDPGHSHTITTSSTTGTSRTRLAPTAGGYTDNQPSLSTDITGLTVQLPTADGTNGTPRTGLETTGKARGVFYIIKY